MDCLWRGNFMFIYLWPLGEKSGPCKKLLSNAGFKTERLVHDIFLLQANVKLFFQWIDGKKSGKNMLNQNTSECFIEKENSITLIWCPWEQVKESKLKKQSKIVFKWEKGNSFYCKLTNLFILGRQKTNQSIRRIFGKLKKTLREEKNRPKINKKQRIEKSDFKSKMRRSKLTSRRRQRDLKWLVKRPLEGNLWWQEESKCY